MLVAWVGGLAAETVDSLADDQIIDCIGHLVRYALEREIKGKRPAAEFIDPWLGDKVNSGIGLSYQHSRLHGWRAGTTTLYPPVKDLWIRQLDAFLLYT